MNDKKRPDTGYSLSDNGRGLQETTRLSGAGELIDATRDDTDRTLVTLPPTRDLKETNVTPALGTPRTAFSELATEVAMLNREALVPVAQFFQKLQDSEHSHLLRKIMLSPKNARLMTQLVSVMHSGIVILRRMQSRIQQESEQTGQLDLSSMEGYIKAATASGESIHGLKQEASAVSGKIKGLIDRLSEDGNEVISTIPPEFRAMSGQSDADFARIIANHPDDFVASVQAFIHQLLTTTSVAGRRILEDSHEGVQDFREQLGGMEALYGEVTANRTLLEDFLISLQTLLHRYERAFELSVHLTELMPMKNLNLLLDQLEPDALKMVRAQYRLTRNKISRGEMTLGNIPKEQAIAHLDAVLAEIETAMAQQHVAAGTTVGLIGHGEEGASLGTPKLPGENTEPQKGKGLLGRLSLRRRKE